MSSQALGLNYPGKGLCSSLPGVNESEPMWCCSRCSCTPKPISHLTALLDGIGLCMLSGHSDLVLRINPFQSTTRFYWQKTGKHRSERVASEIGVKHLYLQVSSASGWSTGKKVPTLKCMALPVKCLIVTKSRNSQFTPEILISIVLRTLCSSTRAEALAAQVHFNAVRWWLEDPGSRQCEDKCVITHELTQ